MANKIIIVYPKWKEVNAGKFERVEETSVYPVLDNPTIEVSSEFATFSDLAPSMEGIIRQSANFSSASGTVSQGTLNLVNMFDVPRWQKTNPVRINTKLVMYTETDSKKDVYDKIIDLVNLNILSRTQESLNSGDKKFTYETPGLSLKNMKASKISNGDDNKNIKKRSKLVSLKIPGIIYLPLAFISKAVPTFSKNITESGYSLWGSLDLEFQSLTPATSDMFISTAIAPI